MQFSRFAFLKDAFAKRPLIAAVVCAVAAALFAAGFLSQKEAKLMRVAEPVPVVIAARDIAIGESLDETKLSFTKVPRRFAEPNALGKMARVSGRVAMVPIRSGSQITSSIARNPAEGFGLAGIIPSGRRAFSISLSPSSVGSTLIRPNDSVDVLATFDLGNDAAARRTTLEIVSNVQVLAVNQKMAGLPDATAEEKTKVGLFSSTPLLRQTSDTVLVTLSVTSAEAQILAFAQESGGLALALRPTGEESGDERTPPTTIGTIVGNNEQLLPSRKGFREYRGK